MTAREELNAILKTDRLINVLLDEQARLSYTLTRSKSVAKPERNVKSEDAATAIARIVDLDRSIDAHVDMLVRQKKEAYEIVKKIPNPDMQSVLLLRYFQGKTWRQIATSMDYSIRSAQRIHGNALKKYALSQKLAHFGA